MTEIASRNSEPGIVTSILYVSYDGLTEPIGQSQVLAYLTRLRSYGHEITVMSYEKPDAPEKLTRETSRELTAAGIRWKRLRYHKRPSVAATGYDVARGVLAGLRIVTRDRVEIVHARSYVPALICMTLKSITGVRFLFDMRNFWADEKVDGGRWKRGGVLWRIAKRLELKFLRSADHVVTLTDRAKEELKGFRVPQLPPASVIPTCVDLALFQRNVQAATAGEAPIVIYSGSLGGRYQDALVGRFFAAMQEVAPRSTLQIWSRQDASHIVEAAVASRASRAAISIRSGSRREVAKALSVAHVGVSLLNDGFSNRSSMPTKIAEYLASGLVVVSSPGVGDLDELLRKGGAGLVFANVAPTSAELEQMAAATMDLLKGGNAPERARRLAEDAFSIDGGAAAYDKIYRSIMFAKS